MQFNDIINTLHPKQRSQNDWRCKCPAHNGTSDDSLSIAEGEDGVALLYCHAGCEYKDIVAAIGVKEPAAPVSIPTAGELSPRTKKEKPKITAVYQYTDEAGSLLFEKVRLEPKSFRVRRPDGKGGYIWNIGDTRRVIYNLPAVIESDTVYVVEGEKDADRLINSGLVATCNFDGASKASQKQKWLPEYNEFFAGKTVYILPDNDEPGWEHAKHIKSQLYDIAKSIDIIEPPDLPQAGDVSDWLDSDHTIDDLISLCQQPKPIQHKWNIKSLQDAYAELKPTEYIIDPILPRRSLNVWFGAPGSLKSMILMDMAFSIRAGGQFIPGAQSEMLCTPSNILWIDLDNGDDVLKERFSAMGRARNIPESDPGFHYVSMPKPWLFVADINSQMDLKMAIQELNVDLIIIDNLGTITGDIEENSAQMVRIMAPLREIATDTDTAIILIHHQRKGGANGNRAGDSLRGHSVIEASLDYAVLVSADDKSGIVNVRCTKARRFRFDDFKAQYSFEHKPGTNDLDLAWFSAPAIKRGTNEIYDTILLVLEATGKMTQERLREAVYDMLDKRYSKAKITSWLKEMSDVLGVLNIEKGPHNAKIISMKDG